MDSNTHSASPTERLRALAATITDLAAQDPASLGDAARAERVLALRRLLDRLEGHWLRELAAVDASGAAGAEDGIQAPSTASWLRARLRMGAGAAHRWVRTARALFCGPLTQTAAALTEGAISPAQASVLAHGTHDLPDHTTLEAEPMLLEAAGRSDPLRLRRVLGHLRLVADPDGAADLAERRHGRRGLWLAPTWAGMVAIDGLLEAEAGQTLLAALEPLARPHRRPRPPQRWPAPGRCLGRAGPPGPGRGAAAPERWGAASAERDRGPGQPARTARDGRRGGGRGRAAGPRGLPAAGL
jgi:hypothetical protein